MAVLTINQYIDSINSFINNVTNSYNSYYLFYGKTDAWINANGQIDDTAIPSANASVYSYEQSIYKDIVFGKLITENDVAHVIPRYNWTNNTLYTAYNQNDANLYDKEFYVVTDAFEVYKCIDNNGGANSTVKPSLTTTSGVFSTADGYVWKYMFTVESNANTKFTTTEYIPVTPNTDVVNNATRGSIDFIKVTAGGNNYQAYDRGYLQNFTNNYVVQIANTASPISGRYVNSAIYLKTGFGSGQLRTISGYSGLNRLVTVSQPFDTSIVLNLANTNGTFDTGLVATQRLDYVSFLYQKGYFNANDQIVQSDTVATGTVLNANATVLKIDKSSVNTFHTDLPFYNTTQSAVLKTGTVDINTTSNALYITANTGTAFTTDFAINDYVRVGDNANTNIRLVTAVNSSVITVNTPLAANVIANTIYKVPYAGTPTSVTVTLANGVISNTNLNSVTLAYDNVAINSLLFTIGERVDMVGGNDIAQGANGIVSFCNTTAVILSSITGSFLTGPNNFIRGVSSLQKANILSSTSFPNITLSSPSGTFVSGQQVYIRTLPDLTAVGNATLIASFQIPNELTEYVISPAVTIEGDGTGALAYSVVNSSFLSSNNIESIVVLNPGENYTYANISITANGLFGDSAAASPVIAPLTGHGSDAYKELGARYAGISMTIDTGEIEGYKFPVHSKYRKIGIIENPLYEEVSVTVGNYDRTTLHIANKSGSGFSVGEFCYQPNTAAAGIVVYANTSYVQIKNTKGSFIANTANDNIIGLTSSTTANVKISNTVYFSVLSNVEIISETTSNASAQLVSANNTVLKLTNVAGRFDANDTVYDAVTNAYANVTSILIANGTVDATNSFGDKFSQVARLTLTSNTAAFYVGEKVTQDVSLASGVVLSTNTDIDIIYTNANGSFSVGNQITDGSTGATATVTFANSTYLRLTSKNGTFADSQRIINNVNIGADITTVYPVLVLTDVNGDNKFQSGVYQFVGNQSGSVGRNQILSTIIYPDLVRNSGSVVYLENVAPVTRSSTTKEKINLVIKF